MNLQYLVNKCIFDYQHLTSPQRLVVARKSGVGLLDNCGVQSADTTKLSLSRPSSAASSLSGGTTDLMSSSAQQVCLGCIKN